MKSSKSLDAIKEAEDYFKSFPMFWEQFEKLNEPFRFLILNNAANFARERVKPLAEQVVRVLDVSARRGSKDPAWDGFQNGDGQEVGKLIELLIIQAKEQLQ